MVLLLLLLGPLLGGCSSEGFRVVANGKIYKVATQHIQMDHEPYIGADICILLDDVVEVLQGLGATVDEDRSERLLAVTWPDAEHGPDNCALTTHDLAWHVVFNDVMIDSACIESEGRVFLALPTLRALAIAMHKRVSDPPYNDLIILAPAVGEDLTASPANHEAVPTIHAPGGKGH